MRRRLFIRLILLGLIVVFSLEISKANSNLDEKPKQYNSEEKKMKKDVKEK